MRPSIASELRPLHLSQGRYPPVVAVAAYFDDSWEGGIFAMAGYIGPAAMWDTYFSPLWWHVIKNAPHPIREFKAADCRQMAGEFRADLGWTRTECDDLTRDVVSVIVEPPSDVFAIGAAVTISDAELRSAEVRAKLPDVDFDELRRRVLNFARTWCATLIAYDALRLAEAHVGDDRIQIIYDEGSDRQWKLHRMFELLRGLVRPDYSGRIRPPHFLPSHELAPLQAADLLAYETYKEMRNRNEPSPRSPSKALERLTKGRPHVARYYHFTDLLKVVEANKAGDRRSVTFPPIYDSSKACAIVRDILSPTRNEDPA